MSNMMRTASLPVFSLRNSSPAYHDSQASLTRLLANICMSMFAKTRTHDGHILRESLRLLLPSKTASGPA